MPAVLVGTMLASTQLSAAVPPMLAVVTSKAAAALASGRMLGAALPDHVVQLAEGVMKAMSLTKGKMSLVLLLAAGLLGVGMLTAAARSERDERPAKPAANAPGAANRVEVAAEEHTVRATVATRPASPLPAPVSTGRAR